MLGFTDSQPQSRDTLWAHPERGEGEAERLARYLPPLAISLQASTQAFRLLNASRKKRKHLKSFITRNKAETLRLHRSPPVDTGSSHSITSTLTSRSPSAPLVRFQHTHLAPPSTPPLVLADLVSNRLAPKHPHFTLLSPSTFLVGLGIVSTTHHGQNQEERWVGQENGPALAEAQDLRSHCELPPLLLIGVVISHCHAVSGYHIARFGLASDTKHTSRRDQVVGCHRTIFTRHVQGAQPSGGQRVVRLSCDVSQPRRDRRRSGPPSS